MSRSQKIPPDPQGISRWARAYAQNRSLPVVVFLLVFVLLYVAIGGASYLAAGGYRSGNMLLFVASLVMLVLALGATIGISVPRWGGKLQEWVTRRLYGQEGNVALSLRNPHAKVWGVVLSGGFGICILASVILGFALGIPSKYMQPISALYMVPFLVGLWVLMRPMVGYAALLWPLFYGIHAILILAGAPILFTGPWDGLNMLIPVAGYGMLAGLVGHFYSRVALRQLKRLAQADLTGADQVEEARGS